MKVEKKYRTNPLSHTEGGAVVRVTFTNGDFRDYDNVKWPSAFCKKVMEVGNDVAECKILEHGRPDKGQYTE